MDLTPDEQLEADWREVNASLVKRGGSPIEERYRNLGQMIVTDDASDVPDLPDDVLVDLTKLDANNLLAAYAKRHARYGTTPFDPDGDMLRLYPGGVTIWSGYPGGGKTTLLRQLVCHCLHKGSSVFLASLEEDPSNLLVKLAGVAAGREIPTAHQMQWFLDAYAERFRLWGVIGIADHKRLLRVIRKLGEQSIRHAIVDSMMCLDVRNDDFEGQRIFANKVAATARGAGVHIHLVAHPRKAISAEQEPDINDVAGARELGAMADNVVFVRRARSEAQGGAIAVSPMLVSVRKQRHGSGALGERQGYFHRQLRQFHVSEFVSEPTHYLPEDAYR